VNFPFLKYYSALYLGAFNGVETKVEKFPNV